MPAERNRTCALAALESLKLQDVVAITRRLQLDPPPSWPAPPIDPRMIDREGIQRLMEQSLAHPDHPRNWHHRAVQRELERPRVRDMYFTMRRNLWTWPEFNTLQRNARRALDVVIELAREEAFPWYVSVCAETVMELAGFECSTFKSRRRDLECFAITRPARTISVFVQKQKHGAGSDVHRSMSTVSGVVVSPRWPTAENNWCVDEREPLCEIPQWVIRYRHGTPFHKRRAAWWINYDLLCGTQRVLPCFVVSPDTLLKTYLNRNRRMGAHASYADADGFAAMERVYAQQGPVPTCGFRAAFWEGM